MTVSKNTYLLLIYMTILSVSIFRSIGLWFGAGSAVEAEAASEPDYFHRGANGGIRARVWANTLPGYIYTRRTSTENKTHRSASTGTCFLAIFHFCFAKGNHLRYIKVELSHFCTMYTMFLYAVWRLYDGQSGFC